MLVVEDDIDIQSLLADYLRAEGYTVRVANNGEGGLALLRVCLPDVVVLDVEMPVLDGPGMAYRMFVEDCGKEFLPIVLVSGVACFREIVTRVGTPYFVAKPFAIEVLLAVLKRALAEKVAPVPEGCRAAGHEAA